MSNKDKLNYLKSCGNGEHRWGGATYEVEGERYRQIYATGLPATRWRKLPKK